MAIKKFNEYVKSFNSSNNFTPEVNEKPVDVEPVKQQVQEPIVAQPIEQEPKSTEKTTHNGKEISGFKEVVEVEGLGKMKAKFDTGNTAYCAIICQKFEEKDGKVTFNFNGEDKTYDIVKHIRIWHHGNSTERPVIKVNMKFNGKEYKDELVDLKISDLTGTKNYRCRMLICKNFMERANILIDPSKDFKLTDKKELPKKKKKKISKKDEK